MHGTAIMDVIDRALDASFSSASLPILNAAGYSVQIVWDGVGNPVGTFQIRESNNGIDWEAVTGASASTGGGAGTTFFNVDGSFAAFAQVNYVRTAGGIGSAAVADAVIKR